MPNEEGDQPDPMRPKAGPTPRKGFQVTQRIHLSKAALKQIQPATLLGPGVTDKLLAQALRKPAAIHISFPRAGRTWLRVMLAHAFQQIFEATPQPPLNLESVARNEPRIPRVIFTSGYADPRRATPEETTRNLDWSNQHRIVLLVRDPRDIAVSLYFDRAHRGPHFKEALPYSGALQDFIREEKGALKTIVAFYNAWAATLRARPDLKENVKLVKYEHLHDDPQLEFGRLLQFLNLNAQPDFVNDLVRHASFDSVRRMETSGRLGYKPPSEMLSDDRALVLRRGLPGGYMDHFNRQDHNYAAKAMADLDPWYAYTA